MAKALRLVADVGASVFWSVGMATAAAVASTPAGCGEPMVLTAMLLTWAVVFANVPCNRD